MASYVQPSASAWTAATIWVGVKRLPDRQVRESVSPVADLHLRTPDVNDQNRRGGLWLSVAVMDTPVRSAACADNILGTCMMRAGYPFKAGHCYTTMVSVLQSRGPPVTGIPCILITAVICQLSRLKRIPEFGLSLEFWISPVSKTFGYCWSTPRIVLDDPKVTSQSSVAFIVEVGGVACISGWLFTYFYYRNNLRSKKYIGRVL